MNSPHEQQPDEQKLQSLIDKVLNGSPAEHELAELADLLESDPSYLSRYVDHVVISELLSWELSRTFATAERSSVAAERSTPAVTPDRKKRSRSLWSKNYSAAIALGIASCFVAIAATTFDWLGPQGQLVARVLEVQGQDGSGVKVGDELRQGDFSLPDTAKATLKFASGATVWCEGPCKLELQSSMLASLRFGKVTAEVPKRATGFTVLTDRVQVIDLGTRFGIEADKDAGVEVVVFDGKVNLRDPKQHKELPRGLSAGEAIRVNESRQVERVMCVGRDPQSTTWTSDWREVPRLERCVFTNVTDNLDIRSTPQFYEIVPGGLIEDARAYSDRVHEWNSLSKEGLPEWLKGADLVRRFNSRKYKYSSQLEVSVTVETDVALYVIWDNRCEPLPWLVDGFRDTGFDIGMDEGPYLGNILPLEKGAGNSINTFYSVWATKVAAGEEVVLGPVGNVPLGQLKNLYGIAAKPLEIIDSESLAMLFGI